MLFVVGAEQMVHEVSVLNPSSHELHIIKLPFSYFYLSSLGTFSVLGASAVFPESIQCLAKDSSGPMRALCDMNHRKPGAGAFSALWLLQQRSQ